MSEWQQIIPSCITCGAAQYPIGIFIRDKPHAVVLPTDTIACLMRCPQCSQERYIEVSPYGQKHMYRSADTNTEKLLERYFPKNSPLAKSC